MLRTVPGRQQAAVRRQRQRREKRGDSKTKASCSSAQSWLASSPRALPGRMSPACEGLFEALLLSPLRLHVALPIEHAMYYTYGHCSVQIHVAHQRSGTGATNGDPSLLETRAVLPWARAALLHSMCRIGCAGITRVWLRGTADTTVQHLHYHAIVYKGADTRPVPKTATIFSRKLAGPAA